MSNYPPGVTGNEPQIAGYPEFDQNVDCQAEGVTVVTMSPEAYKRAAALVDEVMRSARQGLLVPSGTAFRLQNEIADGEEVDLVSCPFEGDVTSWVDQGIVFWECPLCRTVHEADWDPEGFDG